MSDSKPLKSSEESFGQMIELIVTIIIKFNLREYECYKTKKLMKSQQGSIPLRSAKKQIENQWYSKYHFSFSRALFIQCQNTSNLNNQCITNPK